MPNSYPRDKIFNLHLTTIIDSYILIAKEIHYSLFVVGQIKCINGYLMIIKGYLFFSSQ